MTLWRAWKQVVTLCDFLTMIVEVFACSRPSTRRPPVNYKALMPNRHGFSRYHANTSTEKIFLFHSEICIFADNKLLNFRATMTLKHAQLLQLGLIAFFAKFEKEINIDTCSRNIVRVYFGTFFDN